MLIITKFNVNKWLNLIFIFLFITACQYKNKSNFQTANNDNCSPKNNVILSANKVKLLNLEGEYIKESGQLNQGEVMGFSFNAKAGDIFKYKTDQDLCIHIYTQKNDLVKDVELPMDGLYTLQIYLPKGSQLFEINFSLNEDEKLAKKKNENDTISNYQWDLADYPQSTCGDEKPSDSSMYPVNFYPVNIPYNENYFNIVRESYCQDSYKKKDKITGEKIIQVASFLSEDKALSFAQFISEKIPTISVGEPTKIYQ
ncbi:hypothetical protein GM3708_2668 [Geminocystis sp. NIES-3708]|uniref:hypothetical protein n=1 Tax=Geminocystis sp. NIES-3708 TaxID=1615909 RepID=UPI0005FC7400|nr:hypothetical protein [Geminocystis sp. NIES-3708]BAQ62262.1 hypothetical protein GM3708_2668 [Geminocystis sp. NIES-3708]